MNLTHNHVTKLPYSLFFLGFCLHSLYFFVSHYYFSKKKIKNNLWVILWHKKTKKYLLKSNWPSERTQLSTSSPAKICNRANAPSSFPLHHHSPSHSQNSTCSQHHGLQITTVQAFPPSRCHTPWLADPNDKKKKTNRWNIKADLLSLAHFKKTDTLFLNSPLRSFFPLQSVMFETIFKFSCNRICFFSIERQPSDWFQSSGVTHLNSPLIFSIYSPKCTPAKSRCDRFL